MSDTTTARKRDMRNPQNIVTRKAVVKAGETIEKGQIASRDASGYAVNLDTSLPVLGVAVEEYAAGETATFNFFHVERFEKSDASATDVCETAYAADNQTATLSSNTAILGPVVDWGAGYVDVLMTLRA